MNNFNIIQENNLDFSKFTCSDDSYNHHAIQLEKGIFKSNLTGVKINEFKLICRESNLAYLMISELRKSNHIRISWAEGSSSSFFNGIEWTNNLYIIETGKQRNNFIIPGGVKINSLIFNFKNLKDILSVESYNEISNYLNLFTTRRPYLCENNHLKKLYSDLKNITCIKTTDENPEVKFITAITQHFKNSEAIQLRKNSSSRLISMAIEQMSPSPFILDSVNDIADSCHTSIRNLQLAFKKETGMPIKNFLTIFRLNYFRDIIIINPSLSKGSLTAIAKNIGINNFGRFSKQYLQFFNEKPIDTIQRAINHGLT